MYKDNISTLIHSEEWKINMILEIVDCLNGLCENDFTYDENCFYYPILYHMTYQYQIFYIILSNQPLYH